MNCISDTFAILFLEVSYKIFLEISLTLSCKLYLNILFLFCGKFATYEA